MIVLLNCSTSWCQNDNTTISSTGGLTVKSDSVLISYDDLRKANAKIYGNTEINILHTYKNDDNYKVYEDKHPINILRFNTVEKGKVHPTQKPLELLEYLIKTYTLENQVVLDNCMGSGTTGVACKQLNRSFIGIELDEKYFNIAKKRIEGVINE